MKNSILTIAIASLISTTAMANGGYHHYTPTLNFSNFGGEFVGSATGSVSNTNGAATASPGSVGTSTIETWAGGDAAANFSESTYDGYYHERHDHELSTDSWAGTDINQTLYGLGSLQGNASATNLTGAASGEGDVYSHGVFSIPVANLF